MTAITPAQTLPDGVDLTLLGLEGYDLPEQARSTLITMLRAESSGTTVMALINLLTDQELNDIGGFLHDGLAPKLAQLAYGVLVRVTAAENAAAAEQKRQQEQTLDNLRRQIDHLRDRLHSATFVEDMGR
jgi:hypothetical protein